MNENTIINGSLIQADDTDTLNFVPEQITTSAALPEYMLVTLSFEVADAFNTDQDWTLTLKDASGNIATDAAGNQLIINSEDIADFDSDGLIRIRWVAPNNGAQLTAVVETSAGSTFSDAEYELSLTTTALFETQDAVGRLVEGYEVTATASSVDDTDNFGFFVDAGSTTNEFSLTFSAAGTLTLTSSTGSPINDQTATPISSYTVAADEVVTFDLTKVSQFISVEYTAGATGDYTVLLNDVEASGRALDAPILRIGDAILQDSSQFIGSGDTQAPQLTLTQGVDYSLDQLISVSDGADTVYLVASASDGATATIGGSAVSTDAASPTEVAVADLSSTAIQISGDATLQVYAGYASDFTPTDSEFYLLTSGTIEVSLAATAQAVFMSSGALSYQEGDTGTLTVSLGVAAQSDTVVLVKDSGGDIQFSGESSATVTIAAGQTQGTLDFTALANDTDFKSSESVVLDASVTAGDAAGLIVQPLSLTVTESVPELSVSAVNRGLIIDTEVVEYQVTLNNPTDFAAGQNDVVITLSIGDAFNFLGTTADAEDPSIAQLTLNDGALSGSIFVGTSGTTLLTPTAEDVVASSITVGGAGTTLSLGQLSVTRANPEALSVVSAEFSGTASADGFFSTEVDETFYGLGGNDTLSIASDAELVGTFYGGEGTDTVVLESANRADYTAVSVDGTTYIKRLDSAVVGLAVVNVEQVSFADATGVAIADLNSPPTLVAAPSDVELGEGDSAVVDLSGVFSDVEGDSLNLQITYDSSTTLPGWATYDATEQTLTIEPGYTDAGAYAFVIKASDTVAFSDVGLPVTTVNVTVDDVNRKPTAANIDSQFVALSSVSSWSLDVSDAFEDPDTGDTLEFSIANTVPDWLTIDTTTGVFSAVSEPQSSDAFDVTVEASDGSLSVLKSFSLSLGDAPTVSVVNAVTSEAQISLDIAALVSTYGVSAQDISVEWQTSSDLSSWSVDSRSVTTALEMPVLTQGVPTFVRADVTYNDGSALQTVLTDPALVKTAAGAMFEIAFSDAVADFVVQSVDLTGAITSASGAETALTGYGYDLNAFSAASVPGGETFEIRLDASAALTPDVGVDDALSVLRHIDGVEGLSGVSAFAADMDASGALDLSDLYAQLRQIVGLDESLGFKAATETSEGLTSILDSDLVDLPLQWVAMGDIDQSYQLDVV